MAENIIRTQSFATTGLLDANGRIQIVGGNPTGPTNLSMTEEINNGSPRGLEKLKSMLGGMAKEAKRKVNRGRAHPTKSTTKLPRAVCDVCAAMHDFSVQTSNSVPELRRCQKCIDGFAGGFTALVEKMPPDKVDAPIVAFVKGKGLVPGEVVKVSREVILEVQAKLKANES